MAFNSKTLKSHSSIWLTSNRRRWKPTGFHNQSASFRIKSIRKSTMYKNKNLLLKADPKKKTTWKKTKRKKLLRGVNNDRWFRELRDLPCVCHVSLCSLTYSVHSWWISWRAIESLRMRGRDSSSATVVASLLTVHTAENKQTNKQSSKKKTKKPHTGLKAKLAPENTSTNTADMLIFWQYLQRLFLAPLLSGLSLLILDAFEFLARKQTSLSLCVSWSGMTSWLRVSLRLLYLEAALEIYRIHEGFKTPPMSPPQLTKKLNQGTTMISNAVTGSNICKILIVFL